MGDGFVRSLFKLCGFWVLDFLLWVIPFTETQVHTLVYTNSTFFPFQVTLPTANIIILCSPFSPKLPTPTPHSILLFIAWDKWRCYDYFLISLVWKGGPIPSFLSECFVGNSGNSIGTGFCLQHSVQQWYPPRQYQEIKTLYLQATILLTRLKYTERDLLLTFKTKWSHFGFLGSN